MFSPTTNSFILGAMVGGSVGFIGGFFFATVGALRLMMAMTERHEKEVEKLKEQLLRNAHPVCRDQIGEIAGRRSGGS